MEPDFWHERWARNQIGFHEAEGNALMAKHFGALGLKAGARVFVPLCGKTRDIGRLRAQGFRVAGAELSETAVRQLFAEMEVVPSVAPTGPVTRFNAPGIDIFVGDIFDLTPDVLGPVEAVYDRAALVALPAPMRDRYTKHLTALTRAAPQLLLTFEYDQSRMNGPPFSVTAAEVERQYAAGYAIQELARVDLPNGMRGEIPAAESVWLLQPR